MNQKMLKRMLCIILVITVIITTSYATGETAFAAEITELPDVSTEVLESTENDDSTDPMEFVDAAEEIMSTELMESTEDVFSTELMESTEDVFSTELMESTEDANSMEISESDGSDSALTNILTSMKNMLFSEKTGIPQDHSLSVVYWNPNPENTVSGTGQTLQFKGSDDNSGSSAKEPVLNLETAIRRASPDGIIYCMNIYSIETSLTVDGGYYNISIKRDSSHDGNIMQIIDSQVKLSNLTLDGSDNFEERVITVGSGGTLEIGDSFETVGQTLLFVERNANPIVLSGKPENGTVYQVQFAPDYFTNNSVVTEKAEEKLLVDANISGLNPESYISVEGLPDEWDTYVKNGTELWARKGSFGDTVWLDGVNGDDSNNGFFSDECVKTWERAYEIYQSKLNGNGKICIKGTVTVNSGTLEIQKSVIERAEGFINPLFEVKAGGSLSIQSGVVLEETTSNYAVKSNGGLTISKEAEINEIIYLTSREHPLELTGQGENKYRIGAGGNFSAGDLIVKNGIFPAIKLEQGNFGLLSDLSENNSYLCDIQPIYVNGKSGDDAYDGFTPATAVNTLNRAVEIAPANKGIIIYVIDAPANMSSGNVTLSSGMVMERYMSYKGDVLNMTGGTLYVQGDINGSITEKGTANLILNNEYASVKDNIVIEENASFTLDEGEISGNVTVREKSKFIQKNGELSGKIEQNGTDSSVIKDGGTISGGVSITAGQFEMNGGVIEKSGVQLESNGTGSFIMHGGEINECTTSINALSGCIQMDGGTVGESAKGIYLGTNAKMEMTGGTVKKSNYASAILVEGMFSLAKGPIIEGGIELRDPDHPIRLEGALDDDIVCHLNFGNLYVKPGETKTAVEGSNTVPATTDHFRLTDGASYLLSLEDEDASGNVLVCAENEPEGIYWDGDAGDDTNTGVDREHAVKTFERAKELLGEAYEKEGKECNIYICGDITVSDSQVWSLGEYDWNPVVMRNPSLSDVQYGIYITTGGTLNLDNIILDGNKNIRQMNISSKGNSFINVNGGTLNIQSGAVIQNFYSEKGAENTSSRMHAVSVQYGTIILDGGCIRNNKSYGSAIEIKSGGTFEMKSGAIESNENIGDVYGGGVFNQIGTFIMSGGVIRNNKAHYGGGIYSSDGNVEIKGGEIVENEAVCGGGAYIYSCSGNQYFTMTGGKVSRNYASQRGGGFELFGHNDKIVINGGEISENNALLYGGGIDSIGNLCIKNALIKDNKAQYGGGIATSYNSSCYRHIDVELILQGGTISGNQANQGGGIYWEARNSYSELNNIHLEGGTIENNSASKGDGIYVYSDNSGRKISGIVFGKTQINQEIYLGFNYNCDTVLSLIASPTDKNNRFPLTVDPEMAEMGFAAIVPDGTNVTNASQYLRNFYLKGNNGYALVKSGKNIILGQAFFVDGENGSDANKGNSPANAFKTVNHALEALGNDPGTIYVCGTITVPAGTDETWTMKDGQSLTRYEGYNMDEEDSFRGDMIVIEDEAELTMNHVTVYGSIDESDADDNGYLLVQGGILNISSDSSLEDGIVYLRDGKTVTVTGGGTNLLMEIEKENPAVGDIIGRYQMPYTANAANFKLSDQMIDFILEEDEDKNSVILGQVEAVYVDGVSGDDGRDGTTPETALKTMREAYEKIKGKGGIIYIVDTVSLAADTTLASSYYQDGIGTQGTENRVEVSGTVLIRRYSENKNPLINIESGTTVLYGIRIYGKNEETEPYNSSLIQIEKGAVLRLDKKTELNSNKTEKVIDQAGTLYIDSADVSLGDGEIYLAKDAYVTVNAQLPGGTVYFINMDKSDTAAGRTVAVFTEEALGKGNIGAQKEHFSIPSETTQKSLSAKGSDTLVLSDDFDAELLQTEFFRQIGENITFNVVPKNADPSDVTVTVKKGEETVPCTVTDYNRYKRISLQVSEESIGMLTLELQADREIVEKTITVSGYEIRYAKGRGSLVAEPQKEEDAGVHTDTAELIIHNGAEEARNFEIGNISIRYKDDSVVKIDNDEIARDMEDAMGCFGVDVNSGVTSIGISKGEMASIPIILSNGDKITEKKQGAIILQNVLFGSVYPKTDIDVNFETEPASYVQVCVRLDGEITVEPNVYVVNKDTKEKTELTKETVEDPGTLTRVVNGLLEALGAAGETEIWSYRQAGLLSGDYEIYIENPYTGKEVYTGKEIHVEEGKTVNEEINMYTVTYVLNGGKFEDGDDDIYKDIYIEEVGLEKLPSPRRESSRFAGWYENEDFTGTSIGKIGIESKRPYTLYAAWTMQDGWTDVNLGKTKYLEEMGSSFTLEAKIEGILPEEITVQVLQETSDGKTRTVPAKVTDSAAYKLITVDVSPENIGSLTLLFEQKDEDGIILKKIERTVELSAYEVSYANGLGYLLAAPQEDGTDEIHTDRAAITVYNGSKDTVRFTPGSWDASYEGRPNENVWINNNMVDKNMSENNAMRYFGMTLESEEITEIKPGEKATLSVVFSNGDMLTENRSGVITMKSAGLGDAKADIPLYFKVKAITRFQLQLQLNDKMANQETVELRDNNGKTVAVNRMRTGNEKTLVLAYRMLTGNTDARWNYQLTNITPGSYRLYINGKDANRRIQIEEGKVVQEKVDMYSIYYELNEGVLKEEMPSYYIKGTIQPLPRPEKKDCQFAGWYTSATYSGEAIFEIRETAAGILRLYAKWNGIAMQTPQGTGKTPKTADRNLIIVDIAFVGGIACLAKMFLEMGEGSGMDEEDKERRVRSIIENAKGRGIMAGIGAAGLIFVTLLFYYTLGMNEETRCKMQK